jgi:hypothetical protein
MIRRATSVSATGPWTRCFIVIGAAEVSGVGWLDRSVRQFDVAPSMYVRGVADRGYDPGMPLDAEVHPRLGLGNIVCRHAPSGSTGRWPGTWCLGRHTVVGRRDVCLRAGRLRASGFDRFNGVLGWGRWRRCWWRCSIGRTRRRRLEVASQGRGGRARTRLHRGGCVPAGGACDRCLLSLRAVLPPKRVT